MRIFSDATLDNFANGTAIVSGAVAIDCVDPVRVWGGQGPIMLDGESYDPIDDRGLAQVSEAALGGIAQGVTLSLSGVDPDVLPLLDAMSLRRAPVKLYRLAFDGSGTVLTDMHVHTRGRVDEVNVDDIPGGTSTISVAVENPARGLGRNGGRRRSDADQRLIKANDGGFRHIAYAGEKTLYWGGQKPANASAALGGAQGIAASVFSAKFASN